MAGGPPVQARHRRMCVELFGAIMVITVVRVFYDDLSFNIL